MDSVSVIYCFCFSVRSLFSNDATNTRFSDCKSKRQTQSNSGDNTSGTDLLTLNHLLTCNSSFQVSVRQLIDILNHTHYNDIMISLWIVSFYIPKLQDHYWINFIGIYNLYINNGQIIYLIKYVICSLK